MDLALNNLQRLICHKTQQTKTKTKPNHQPFCMSSMQHKVSFYAELLYQGKRTQSALQFTYCWRANSWIQIFAISAVNVSSLALGAIAMKRYSAFSKAPASLVPHHKIV